MTKHIPASVSDYMATIGKKGGSKITAAKAKARAAKGGLARAKKHHLGRYARKPKP